MDKPRKINGGFQLKSTMTHCKIENEYETKVREELYDSGEFSDVRFVVGTIEPREFHAHQLVLMTGSSKFKRMIELHKDLEKPIAIPEIEPDVFDQLLK